MLVSMKSILDHANEHTYGVMAVNSINIEMVRAVITAAEEERSPIIVQMGPGQIAKHAHLDEIVPVVKELAKKATVPVAYNLDHGSKLEDEIRAIQYGFTNVMIDASSLPFEENIKQTSTIVSLAHPMGISVEAELGHVGQAADGDGRTDDMYTNVAQAREFVDRTKVDALAVAIGTAHGFYVGTPVLDKERLSEIRKVVSIPLVLHGASGLTDGDVSDCVKRGICKVNFSTELRKAYTDAVKKLIAEEPSVFDPKAFGKVGMAAVKELVKGRMKVCGCDGKAK